MPPSRSTISIPTKLLATGVAGALAILVCGTAATVVVASDVTNRVAGPGRNDPFHNNPANFTPRGSFRDAGATAQAIDSLLRPLGTPLDAASASVQLAAFNADQGANSIWATPPEAGHLPGPVPSTFFRRQLVAHLLDSLTPAQRAKVTTALKDPWLPIFRTWARSSPQPALWGYRAGLPGEPATRGLPIRSFDPWRALFAVNEYASVLALREGQPQTAMTHALENIAAARHFIEQPVMIDALVGRLYLQRGLQLVAMIAHVTGDTATAERALQLDSAAHNFVDPESVRFLAGASGDASSTAVEQFVANHAVHPALRYDALHTITTGGCRSLPEVVFGFSTERRTALVRAGAGLSDLDRGSELADRELRLFDYMMTSDSVPERLPPTSILERSVILNAFSWIVPPGVRARSAMCLRQGYRNQGATVRENAVVGLH